MDGRVLKYTVSRSSTTQPLQAPPVQLSALSSSLRATPQKRWLSAALQRLNAKLSGVFPLRGEIMNVKDTSGSKIELAKEIAELKKIVGLESGRPTRTWGPCGTAASSL